MYKQPTPKLWLKPGAVSYTHLDVYKRQVHTSGQSTKEP